MTDDKNLTEAPEEILEQDNKSEIDMASNYSSKGEFSKAIIVSEVIRKVIEYRSKEMRSGYFNTTLTANGEEIKTWVADSRKNFISAVIALSLTLSPEMESDAKAKKADVKYHIEEKKLFEKFCYEDVTLDESKNLYKKNGCKFIPEIDYKVKVMLRDNNGIRKPSSVTGQWNDKVEQYWIELLSLADDLFKELNMLLHRIGYFNNPVTFG